MTILSFKYSAHKENTVFYLYKFPLLITRNTGSSTVSSCEKLKSLFVESSEGEITYLDLDLSEVDWSHQTLDTRLRQVFIHYNEEIFAEYD